MYSYPEIKSPSESIADGVNVTRYLPSLYCLVLFTDTPLMYGGVLYT